MPTTFERLREILVRDYRADAAAVTPDAPLESLNIDSLGVAELLFTIEDAFGVQLTKEVAAMEMTTVADVVALIDRLVAARSGVDPATASTTSSGTSSTSSSVSEP